MEVKVKTFSQYQLYCILAIGVMAVLPHHARASAIFHVMIAVLAVIGIIVLEVKKQALKRTMAREKAQFAQQNPGVTPGVWPPPPQT